MEKTILNKNILSDEEGLEVSFSILRSEDGKFHFVVTDGKSNYGSGTAVPVEGEDSLINIESIYIDPSIRGVGIGTRLLSFIEAACKRAGYKGIFAKAIGDNRTLYPINSFFSAAGYMCSGYQSYILTYEVEDIENSRFSEIIEKFSKDKSVQLLGEISPNMLKTVTNNAAMVSSNINKCDKNYSSAVVNDGTISAIVICEKDLDRLCITDIVILPENKDKGILMRILNALVIQAKEHKMTSLIMRTVNSHIEDGLSKCMVYPRAREYEQEFVKAL